MVPSFPVIAKLLQDNSAALSDQVSQSQLHFVEEEALKQVLHEDVYCQDNYDQSLLLASQKFEAINTRQSQLKLSDDSHNQEHH